MGIQFYTHLNWIRNISHEGRDYKKHQLNENELTKVFSDLNYGKNMDVYPQKYNRMALFRGSRWHSYTLNSNIRYQKIIIKNGDTRGIFILEQVIEEKLEEQWVDLNDVWHSPSPSPSAEVGYFGGGYTSGPVSVMDKVTYSSDTTVAVPGAILTSNRAQFAATGGP